MYNQVQHFNDFKEEFKFYTIGEQINSGTWIVSNNIRKDYGCNYSISAPVPVAEGKEAVPAEIRECFSNSGLIPWNNMNDVTFFTMTPKPVTDMIVEVSSHDHGNVTEIHPSFLYLMEREEALQIGIPQPKEPNVEIRRLDPSNGDDEFIIKTWKYALPGTEVEIPKYLSRNASGGVFVNGKCVSGVYIPAIGFMSALYTAREHRNKGYAKLTMRFAFKEYAKDGFIPCSTVEFQNSRSMSFHEGLGLKRMARADEIFVKKLVVD